MKSNLKKTITEHKRAGVSFPLSSVFTHHSSGSGDIYSLQVIGEWAKKSGISILQILPLNDLGFGRSPYSSVSAFAIDPIYISLHLLGIKTEKVNSVPKEVHFTKVRQEKLGILGEHFNSIANESFFTQLDHYISKYNWIRIYATFKVLYERNEGIHWSFWNDGNSYSNMLSDIVAHKHKQDFYFQVWLQKIAFEQLSNAAKHLEKIGVFLKGDMPILTSDNSADVWANPDLFDRSLLSGAPPDNFNSDGQNWGFPIINWKNMESTGYRWWKERLHYLENFYHLYRIDHVLGMYRIWAIQRGTASARKGYFHPQIGASRREFNELRLFPEDFLGEIISEFSPDKYIFHWDFLKSDTYQRFPETIRANLYTLSAAHCPEDELFWKDNGEKILNLLMKESGMIPCAEDLGAVPSFVRTSILELGLIGLDIIRWTRSFEDGSYILPEDYRPIAVSALSVHDTSTALGWWNETSVDDKAFFLKSLHKVLKHPKLLEDSKPDSELMRAFLEFAFSAASLYSIHMLQDYIFTGNHASIFYLNPEDHRINVPGTTEELNWGYAFPVLLEDLSQDTILSTSLKKLISKYKREA
jgi:4-alpha-glucanotransferase